MQTQGRTIAVWSNGHWRERERKRERTMNDYAITISTTRGIDRIITSFNTAKWRLTGLFSVWPITGMNEFDWWIALNELDRLLWMCHVPSGPRSPGQYNFELKKGEISNGCWLVQTQDVPFIRIQWLIELINHNVYQWFHWVSNNLYSQ